MNVTKSLIIGWLFTGLLSCHSASQLDIRTEVDSRVVELMSKMTLKEKVGQMTQLTIGSMSNKKVKRHFGLPITLDTAKVRRYIVEYGIGSVLNTGRFAHTKEQWNELIGYFQKLALEDTKNGIPILYGIDAIHGTNYTVGATLYPQQVGLAATWNPSLVEELAELTAYETRASGIPWTFSPVLDLGIDPRWPRIWEGFGEDPYLTAQMGLAMQSGFQGDDISDSSRVAACIKHFIGYSNPRSGKDRTPAWIPERMMRELFIPPFKEAINQGATSIMINSGEVNGIPVHANYDILTKLLKKELNFSGLVVTDWYDIYNLVERHHVAVDRKEATKMAINAGIDMAMVPNDIEFADCLTALVNEGEVPMSRIDDAVRKILKLKFDLGLFDSPLTDFKNYPDFGSDKHIAKAKEGALESIVLLKNDNDILPLSKRQKVLVCGPNSDNMRVLNGGWSYTWQGQMTDQFAKEKLTILEAIQGKVGHDNVLFEKGVAYSKGKYWKDEIVDMKALESAAMNVDVVVACIGENTYTEKQGDLDDLVLSVNQKELVKLLSTTGKPIVLVINEGRPRIIRDEVKLSDAVIDVLLPGNEGGEALADILYGDANPSGKLPFTYPSYTNDLIPYFYKYSEASPHADGSEYNDPFIKSQWPFGFGLSYTKFKYSNLKIDKEEYGANDVISVSVDVENIGDRGGKEVVQLYSSDLVASVTPSVKRLRKFEKLYLNEGESKTVFFELPIKDLAFVDRNYQKLIEKGDFKITVADQSTSFNVSETLVVEKLQDWRL
ncbi:glycoside hydrolase family 3 N-terminal domain-containing protein [Reichenbachiella versicolor]|uniref:glycoside hydrolase family 3 N-terminal domain-containing protein n=1 Tax=Reichenbachiella versicolor TaxID=1821036 RepID=UPI000D6E6390|nr:glycoside hydrolase family 3 N-terminal domain-containing protein [Reichenbachiella versicolor]